MGWRRISVRGGLRASPPSIHKDIQSFPPCLVNCGGSGAEPPTPGGGMAMTDGRARNTAILSEGICPSRNDGVTIARGICSACGGAFHPTGRRRYCCKRRAPPALVPGACRQAAWRHRHPSPKDQLPPPNGEPRSETVYECPSCGSRYLDEQRCPDCQLFCRRVGPGRGAASPSPAAAAVPTATSRWPSPTSLATRAVMPLSHSRPARWAIPDHQTGLLRPH